MNTRTLTLLAAALATTIALAGCSVGNTGSNSDPGSSSTSTEAFNNPDVTFVMGMVPHHEQAVEMSQMILDKDGIDPRVTELAQQIKDAQGPEIDLMKSWLDAWGAGGSMGGMNHDMGGMMSDDDMAALDAASGPDASSLFLTQMTAHHQGAIMMAEMELKMGENPGTLELAQKIIDSQTAEIATMKKILDSL